MVLILFTKSSPKPTHLCNKTIWLLQLSILFHHPRTILIASPTPTFPRFEKQLQSSSVSAYRLRASYIVAIGRFPQTCVTVMFTMDLQSRRWLFVLTSGNTLELTFRNVNDILQFEVLFVICLFLSVEHFILYSLFRILVNLF